jgi:hypothetical protein
MADRRRIRLSEDDAMERGVRCPNCGTYTSFTDILATNRCRGVRSSECETHLWLDLVVDSDYEGDREMVDVDVDG